MAAKKAKWVEIGTVGVDAGMLMIGDPCYFIGEKAAANEAFPDWDAFIKAQRDSEGRDWTARYYGRGRLQLRHQMNYALGHAGLGVVAGTAHGDGVFRVYALKTDDTDRTQALMVITGDMEPPV